MTVQSNGDIVLAGTSDDGTGNDSFALARYSSSGWLDGGFGNGGLVTASFGDGFGSRHGRGDRWRRPDRDLRRLVCQTADGNTDTQDHFALLRYNSDGSLDTTFGTGTVTAGVTTDFSDLGFSTESASGIMVDPTGRLIVAGTATQSGYSSFAVACYDPAGDPGPPGQRRAAGCFKL